MTVQMNKYLFQGGTVVTPAGQKTCDVLVENGLIAAIGTHLPAEGAIVVLAKNMLVAPGLVDMHCHLREPGQEYKESIASGTAAAAKGGFTSICCMANTQPINDTAAVTAFIKQKAREAGPVHVYPVAAVTKGLEGKVLTEVGELQETGAVALSDDGRSIKNPHQLRLALSYAKTFGMLIMSHPEDEDMVNGGLMNEGYWSTILGMAGITCMAEEMVVARDCMLAELEKGRVHIAHISTAGCVEIIRQAKKRGVYVTCETAPHYLYATDAWVEGYDTATKVNPPLRTEADRLALIEGLKDGTIDCIATDHAPHHIDDKRVEYAVAASGISGFETAFGICWMVLVQGGHLTPEQLFEKMATNPARILGLPAGTLEVGKPADIIIVAPNENWVVDPTTFLSKGKNTPFTGKTLVGAVKYTMAGGCIAYEDVKCNK